MTIEEKLTRCAALIEKIKRGPVWKTREGIQHRLIHDGVMWVIQYFGKCVVETWWKDSYPGKHEADCILQVWLEDVELPKKDVFIHRFEGYYLPVIEVYSSEDDDWPLHKDGEFKEADPDEGTEAWAYTGCKFTALIEAAEKVLVAA